jgi:hypothetical protein
MKKYITFLVAAVFSFIYLNCEDKFVQPGSEDISGIWYNQNSAYHTGSSSGDTLFYIDRFEISFLSGSGYKEERKIYDASNNEFLGYRYIGFGSYSIIGNKLKIVIREQAFSSDEKSFYAASLSPAEISPVIRELAYSIKGNILTIVYPPCAPNENCIGSQTFYKK